MKIADVYSRQVGFFATNATKNVAFRIEQLRKLKGLIKANEALMFEAIYDDFGKSEFETFITEFSLIYEEINLAMKHLRRWSKRRRVATSMVNFPATSYIVPEPLGITLVIGAWNYPFQLSLVPAIASLAAGNTVVMKPSELPSRTSAAMANLINAHFAPEYFRVVEGGITETTELLEHRFDKIFFTGSTPVGKIIYRAAAKHLTPVTLELGGKSPVFVLADTDIKTTAKRIVWAKFLNAGQTCVAPDYILVEKSVENTLLEALRAEIMQLHPDSEGLRENYTRIINEKNVDRLIGLIDNDKVFYGGRIDREQRLIEPTILQGVNFEDAVMKEEIFGPLLPVLSFEQLEGAIQLVKEHPKPLSCYIYSRNRSSIKKIINEVSFGGGAVNDSIMHLTNSNLPFGGVGHSGIGSYHGKFGFDTFSHYKSIMDKPFWFDPFVKYPPYSALKFKLVKWLFK